MRCMQGSRLGLALAAVLASWGAFCPARTDGAFTGERCAARATVGSFEVSTSARDLALSDGAVAVLSFDLDVYDIRTEASPSFVRTVDLPGGYSRLERDDAQLWALGQGVCLIENSDPLNPIVLGAYAPSTAVSSADAAGTLAVIASDPDPDLGIPPIIRLVDFTDPASPLVIAERAFDERVRTVSLVDGVVYAVMRLGSMLVLGTDGAQPEQSSGSAGAQLISAVARGATPTAHARVLTNEA